MSKSKTSSPLCPSTHRHIYRDKPMLLKCRRELGHKGYHEARWVDSEDHSTQLFQWAGKKSK